MNETMEKMEFPGGENALRTERKNCSRIGWILVECLVLSVVGQLLLVTVVPLVWPELASNMSLFMGLTLVGPYVISLPIALLIARGIPKAQLGAKPMTPVLFGSAFVIGIAMLYVGALVGSGANALLYAATGREPVNQLESVLGNLNMGTIFLCACLLGPIAEEIVFRYLLAGRLSRYGQKRAIVISGLLFGLFHGNLSQFFYAVLLGMLLAYVFLSTGRLRHAIILHVLYNVMGSGLPLLLSGSLVATGIYGMIMILLSITGIVLFFLMRKKAEFLPVEIPVPSKTMWCNVGVILSVLCCLGMFAMNYMLT